MINLALKSDKVNQKDPIDSLVLSFERHKNRALGATNYAQAVAKASKLQIISKRSYENLKECGSELFFDVYKNREGEFKRHLSGANFCRNKFCPMCMWRKSRKVALENYSILSKLAATGDYNFLFLTITVPNCLLSDLRRTVRKLSLSFTNFIRRKKLKSAFFGYIKGLEIFGDHTPEGFAHPHYHILLVVKKSYFSKSSGLYITHERIKSLWQEYYPESTMVRIQAVKSKSCFGGRGLLKAVLETSKYALKEEHLSKRSVNDLVILIQQTKGIRLYDRGGVLRTIKPEPLDDFSNTDSLEYITSEFYRFSYDKSSYVLVEHYYDSEQAIKFSSGAPPPSRCQPRGLTL